MARLFPMMIFLMTLATLMVSTGAQEFSKEYGLLDKTYNTASPQRCTNPSWRQLCENSKSYECTNDPYNYCRYFLNSFNQRVAYCSRV